MSHAADEGEIFPIKSQSIVVETHLCFKQSSNTILTTKMKAKRIIRESLRVYRFVITSRVDLIRGFKGFPGGSFRIMLGRPARFLIFIPISYQTVFFGLDHFKTGGVVLTKQYVGVV